jgi:putative endonuclease
MDPKTIGQSGEDAAADFLRHDGYAIVERNCRLAGTEIDIIAEKDRILCFIEVKTRKSKDFGYPEEFVNPKKIGKLIRGAKIFSARKKFRDFQVRFDIIALIGSPGHYTLTHIEDAFGE